MATFRYIREGERHDGSAVHFSRRDAPRTRVVLLPPLLFAASVAAGYDPPRGRPEK